MYPEEQDVKALLVMWKVEDRVVGADLGLGKFQKDDRARSYKGVVINGDGGRQDNDKDQKGYSGKGKGKMYEEQENKWVRVPERGNKRSYSNRNHGRFEEGGSRNRNSRWEQPRGKFEEEREGSGSNSLQHEAMPKPATPSRTQPGTSQPLGDSGMVVKLVEQENGVELVREKLDVANNCLDKEGINVELERSKEVVEADGEDKEVSKDDASGDLEESLVLGNTEGLESTTTAGEKKAGARKQLFSIAAGGNNMKKFAQVLHSPRKRTTVKQGVRKGGGAKQAEEKGPSHPKQPKP
ncbi:hypothetical protein Bca101_074753 [Brassica carinata]